MGPRPQQPRVEIEPHQEHVENDADLRDDAEVRRDFAPATRTASPPAKSSPNSDGPSMMPATISPITRGWPKWTNSFPSQRPNSRIATRRPSTWQQDVGLGRRLARASPSRPAAATGVSCSPKCWTTREQPNGDDQHQRIADRQPPGRRRMGVGRKAGIGVAHESFLAASCPDCQDQPSPREPSIDDQDASLWIGHVFLGVRAKVIRSGNGVLSIYGSQAAKSSRPSSRRNSRPSSRRRQGVTKATVIIEKRRGFAKATGRLRGRG